MRRVKKRLPHISLEMRKRAKELRKNMTLVESKLFRIIRMDRFGVNFRCQYPVGNYICDFVSINGGLVIEVDGSQHYLDTGRTKDAERDVNLRALGFRILRFSNRDVLKNPEGVYQSIKNELGSPPFSSPPETGGGGFLISPLLCGGE